jgi:hypothetical protein
MWSQIPAWVSVEGHRILPGDRSTERRTRLTRLVVNNSSFYLLVPAIPQTLQRVSMGPEDDNRIILTSGVSHVILAGTAIRRFVRDCALEELPCSLLVASLHPPGFIV